MSLKQTIIAIVIAFIPLIFGYITHQNSLTHSIDTRIAVLERVVPSRLELKDAVTEGVKDGLSDIIENQQGFEKDMMDAKLRIRTLEVKVDSQE